MVDSTKQTNSDKLPTVILVVGMAGSGKTTFINMLSSKLTLKEKSPYIINLDPAVLNTHYTPNIDIRDNVSYNKVRQDYNLGPNGAIVTSLNLYATRFDQIIKLIEDKQGKYEYVLIDTPGQIEVFTWSASGTIITDLLAFSFPTCVFYITDSRMSSNPITFMSNMLYTCSIMYKFGLPFLLCLNKCDLVGSELVSMWIKNFELYSDALEEDPSYAANLSRSLSFVLDKFYDAVETISVSSTVGTGFDDIVFIIGKLRHLYFSEYVPYYKKSKMNRKGGVDSIEVGAVDEDEFDGVSEDQDYVLDSQFEKKMDLN